MTIQMNLQERLQLLTDDFADAVLTAVRGASIDEILGTTASKAKAGSKLDAVLGGLLKEKKPTSSPAKEPGRLKRRTPEQIVEAVGVIASLLRRSKKGLRSEEVKKHLGLDAREMPRLLKEGLATGAIKILSGQKRATVYGVGTSSKKKVKPTKKVAKKVVKKTAKRVKKPAAKK